MPLCTSESICVCLCVEENMLNVNSATGVVWDNFVAMSQ